MELEMCHFNGQCKSLGYGKRCELSGPCNQKGENHDRIQIVLKQLKVWNKVKETKLKDRRVKT